MRRILVLLAALLLSRSAQAGTPIYAVTSAPSGSCSASSEGTRVEVVGSTGAQYCCASGTWSVCGGSPDATSTVTGGIRLTGDLGGTATSPTVVDNSHAHTATTISGLDAADVTTGTFAAARLGTYDIAAFFPGKPGANALMARLALTRASSVPSGLVGSNFLAGTLPVGSTAITLKKRTGGGTTTTLGTITFAANGTVGISFATATFAAGDFIEFHGPAVADTALANVSITLLATKL
jgi:hypothetical protein